MWGTMKWRNVTQTARGTYQVLRQILPIQVADVTCGVLQQHKNGSKKKSN